MWTEKIAKAEYGNVPVGAIWWASLAQALTVLGYAALQKKWPASVTLAKWAPTITGTTGAVLVPQTGKFIGEATAKSLAIGCGNVAAAPWLGKLFNAILYPTPPAAGRRQIAQRRIAGRGNPAPNPNPGPNVDLNGEALARELDAMV